LDDLYSYTIEARIGWVPGDNVQTIVYNYGDYWLYLDGDNSVKILSFRNGDSTEATTISSTHGIASCTLTYVAVTVLFDETTQQWYGKLYINGILDAIGPVDPPVSYDYDSATYIGTKYDPFNYTPTCLFNGLMDDIVISNYAKTFHEDTDAYRNAPYYIPGTPP
jgi:hypothetical protein